MKSVYKFSHKIVQLAVYGQRLYQLRNKRNELANMPKFDPESVKKRKKSDVLFVLGSSREINELSKHEWSIVSMHNSMAMNRFCFHDFVPDFYWLELSRNIPAIHYRFEEIRNKYSRVQPIFILNYNNIRESVVKFKRLPEEVVNNACFVQPKVMLDTSSMKEVMSNLNKLSKDIKQSKVSLYSFQHVRGSLFTCCQIGWAMGYKKIVLLGVSLNDQKYFYEELHSKNAAAMMKMDSIQDIYEGRVGDRTKKHRTAREDAGTQAPPITDLLELLYKKFLQPSGVEMYVQSSESLLANFLPVYDWSDI